MPRVVQHEVLRRNRGRLDLRTKPDVATACVLDHEAGEARAAEVNMTNATMTEVVASRRQVTLRDAVAPQDPRDTPCRGGGGRRRHRGGGSRCESW